MLQAKVLTVSKWTKNDAADDDDEALVVAKRDSGLLSFRARRLFVVQ
jgi:hypothetical protein